MTTKLEDLDLTHLPMEDGAFARNPWPHFEAARERHPWLAKYSEGYVVNDYAAAKDLLYIGDQRMQEAGASVVALMGAEGTPWGRFQVENVMARDGDTHSRLRRAVGPMFTPQQANRFRPLMREVISELLDEWAPKGTFDFHTFAANFPITVMCRMIGASTAELPHLLASLEAFGMSFCLDPDFMPELEKAMAVLDDFVQELVADRRAGKRMNEERDLLDGLIGLIDEGQLTEREAYDMLIFLFVGGYDTSKNLLTLTMQRMIDSPEIYERCAVDLDYCRKVIEEMARYNSVSTLYRLTTEDIVYRDVLLPKGTMLTFPVSTLGRDPNAFKDGFDFVPGREYGNKHIGFGHGVHVCLGQFIARAQLEEGLHLIAQRIRRPKVAGPIEYRGFIGVWGLETLPIEFEPATSGEAVAEPA